MRPVSWTVWSAVFNTTVIFKWPRDSHLSVCSRGFIHAVLKLEFWENKQRIKSAISIWIIVLYPSESAASWSADCRKEELQPMSKDFEKPDYEFDLKGLK